MMMNRTLVKKTIHIRYTLNPINTLEMFAAKERQESIAKDRAWIAKERQESTTKVRAWLGIPDTEHKAPDTDKDNPLDMTEMAKSLCVNPPEITEIPKELTQTTEEDNTPKRGMTLSEARKHARKHARNAQLPKVEFDAESPEITEIPKTTEGDNTPKRLILRIKERDGLTTTSAYVINGHIVTQRTSNDTDTSVDIFQ